MNFGNYPTYMPQFQQAYQPQQTYQQQNTGVRLVASKAEVVAAQIPFDGMEYFFKDTSTGKIYGKSFNMVDGTAPITTYSREQEHPVQYATIEDINALREEIEALKGGQSV